MGSKPTDAVLNFSEIDMNWTTLTQADISASKIGAYLVAAQDNGFDVSVAIDDVTAQIRAAVSAGNLLDLDATKIPKSLKGLALRMLNVLVKFHLDQPLNPMEEKLQADDASFLRRVIDEKLKFETPDNADGSAEMQETGAFDIASDPPCNVPDQDSLGGLF